MKVSEPTERDRVLAEMDHLRYPQSDFPYGHQFRREGEVSACRCGFKLEPIREPEQSTGKETKMNYEERQQDIDNREDDTEHCPDCGSNEAGSCFYCRQD